MTTPSRPASAGAPEDGDAFPARSGLPRGVTVLLGLAGGVVSVAGLRAFGGTIGPAFLALVLVLSVQPASAWLRRHGAPAWVAVITTLLLVYAILLALVAGLVYAVAQLVTLLPTYAPQFTDLLDEADGLLRRLGVDQSQITAALGQVSLSNLVGPLRQVLGQVTTLLSDLAFVVTLVFFLGLESVGFPQRLAAVGGQRARLVSALVSFAASTRRYVLVSTAFGLLVAVLNVGELYWIGVPLPVLWGLLAFITNYVPNIGFVLGLVPPALLALLEGGVGRLVAVVVAYSVTNLLFQSAIQPKVVGDSVGLAPTLTFLSLVFWTFVIGPLGALLAVPLSLLVKALLVDADPALQWLRPLLGDRAGEPDERAGLPRPRRTERARVAGRRLPSHPGAAQP